MIRKITVLISVALALLTACRVSPEYKQVSLAARPGEQIERVSSDPLRIAVAAVISPQGTTLSYSPLMDYLGERLDRQVILVQRQTYAEVNDLIRDGEVDLAFICTGAYVQGGSELNAELVAAPQVGGKTVYYAYIIVPADSDIYEFSHLRGRSFAFTDPLSNSGKLAAVHLLWQQGEVPEKYFAETMYTFSHDNSIRAVADGLVDGAAVDSLVYDYLMEREPSLSRQVRVIERSVPYGIPPVVLPASLDQAMKENLSGLILTIHQDPEGKKILEDIGIDRFVTVDDTAYDSVRLMLAQLEQQP